ncbi:MAG: PqiC family protein [Deltaproteobacteria bacterium]|nr:PqiC family protein [Deltaproteobacteria bacterium]
MSSLPQSALSAAEGTVIGVFPVSMPDYLDRPQIVTRVSENEIRLDEFSRWAEPLKESFTRTLVQNLSSLLNTAKVINTTESTGFPLVLQVGVEVVQFDGSLGGDAVLIVKWGLFEADGKKLIVAKRSSFKEPTGAATYEALVAAESRAVTALSREIAEAIKTRK